MGGLPAIFHVWDPGIVPLSFRVFVLSLVLIFPFLFTFAGVRQISESMWFWHGATWKEEGRQTSLRFPLTDVWTPELGPKKQKPSTQRAISPHGKRPGWAGLIYEPGCLGIWQGFPTGQTSTPRILSTGHSKSGTLGSEVHMSRSHPSWETPA